jgi:hypothetical protein
MFKYLNYIIIAVLISLLLTLNIYFIWAQNNNKWPFHKDDKGDKNRFMKNKYLRDISSGDSSGSMSFGVIIVLMYFATKASIARYQFAGEAMKHGNNAVAAAALAPEIGQGVGAVLGDVFNPNYKYQNFN